MSTRNWDEDIRHENGNYSGKCHICGERFIGHKRRITCKACAVQPAPVSATEPLTCERCGIADADVRFDGDFSQHPTDGGCFFALVGERNTLRARVAELERVTEEQVEKMAQSIHWHVTGYPWDDDTEAERDHTRDIIRKSLTAARGGG